MGQTVRTTADEHAKAVNQLAVYLAASILSTAAPGCRQAAGEIITGAAQDETTGRHLRSCVVCRMRQEEARLPARVLCDSVPLMPLLGLQCHRRWQAG